ncbi:unnamed protein product [Brassica oleracea var. botrytis]|uniref:Uncharacterized protein n=3 Tax=Brassica TaxID=3705 RepID=A0A0D3E9A9_BRAOL|nr:unnamed protein product [Brassica napus]CDY13269.1 BnaC09g23870D [Brassica napus]VDD31016.1 unnamed protein product [Brassica oleracea]
MADHGGCNLKIGARVVLEDVKLSECIAINGTCLTVTEFTVGLLPEEGKKYIQ